MCYISRTKNYISVIICKFFLLESIESGIYVLQILKLRFTVMLLRIESLIKTLQLTLSEIITCYSCYNRYYKHSSILHLSQWKDILIFTIKEILFFKNEIV